MSDLNIYKNDDIVWDEFVDSYDHMVPYQGGEHVNGSIGFGDSHKKPRHEVENDPGSSTDCGGSVPKNDLHTKEPTIFWPPLKDGSFTILEGEVINDYFKERNKDAESNTFCSEILQTRGAADHNGCHFSLPADTGPDFLGNEHKGRENDHLNYDWPDISNLEDVDKTFRNCDSTFGRGSLGTGDEISWILSSSHAIYGSEDTFRSTVRSSVSGLNSTVVLDGTSTRILPENNLSTRILPENSASSLGNRSFVSISDCENKGESAVQGQITVNINELEKQYSCKGKGKDLPSEYMNSKFFLGPGQMQQFEDQEFLSSVLSDPQSYPSPLISKQQHCWGFDSSSYMSTFNPQVKLEHGLLPDQVTSCIPQMMERFPDPLSKPSSVTPEYLNELAASANITSDQNKHHKFQHEIGEYSELKDISIELPENVIDSSTVQESPCMTYVFSDDVLLKASSFQQLQDVADQLDVGTKLCIRDSLYRLANSAVQRHTFSNTNNGSGEYRIPRRSQGTEDTRFAEFMAIETDTNPIDRSVAHLLFHWPLELTARSTDDAMLLGSIMIN